jgi:hypothetical protein
MDQDRRVRRSQDLSEALELQIAATVRRARFNSLALAEECGFVVAGCGNSEEIQELHSPPTWQERAASGKDGQPPHRANIA